MDNARDVVMVGYDPAIMDGKRVLENDNVTVCGTYIGIFQYESTIGATISVPAVYGDIVIVN